MVYNLVVWLLARKRRTKQITMMLADSFIVMLAIWLAYSIRFNAIYEPNYPQLTMILAGPVIAIPLFYGFGLYRSLIRYVGEHAIWSAFKAVGLTALLWGLLAFMIRAYGAEGVPRSVLVMFWLLTLIMVISSRFVARWFLLRHTDSPRPQRHIIIYGAGEAARQIAASLKGDNPRLSILHVVDDPNLHGSLMGGDAVYPANDVPDLIKRYDIKDAIVTLRTASNTKRVDVVEALRKLGVKVRILPAFADIADGKHAVNMIREVEIGDLLGREIVTPDKRLMEANTTGKVVMVTGGGGTIGSELCRQAASLGAAKLVLMETSEFALYQIKEELELQAGAEIVPVLGSVNDGLLVRRVIREHKVQTVFHAAAYKHVPLVQANCFEGVRNNALGTLSIASAVYDTDAEALVLISTDKAVCSTSVMGASKRIAELIVQDFAVRARQLKPEKTFCAVRFGNVLGSSGSVVPLFRRQIRSGGPITITDPDVTRYFMSIAEAAQLVIQASSLARPENMELEDRGRIFILDMGQPVRIMDLAIKLIELSNLTLCDDANPEGDIAIKAIGLRPGEKLHEVLLESVEPPHQTKHPKISVAVEPPPENLDLEQLYRELDLAITDQDQDKLMDLLAQATGQGKPVEPLQD